MCLKNSNDIKKPLKPNNVETLKSIITIALIIVFMVKALYCPIALCKKSGTKDEEMQHPN